MKQQFLNLGKQPLANNYLNAEDIRIGNEYFYDLKVGFDSETKLVTQMEYVDAPLMFNDKYSYRGSMSKTMQDHFRSFNKCTLLPYKTENPDIKILEIGSNDGVFLKHHDPKTTFAVEPCGNFAKETQRLGYETYNEFWTYELSEKIKQQHGTMDIIFAANCICHIPDLDQTFKAIYNLLSEDGVFIFEDPSLAQMINNTSYDQIYDEHPHIFSVIALKNILSKHGLTIVRVDNLSVHGGSNRIYVQKQSFNSNIDKSVKENIEFEHILGLNRFVTFERFAQKVRISRIALFEILRLARAHGKRTISYGATSKSTTIFNYSGLSSYYFDYVHDTTPEKIGKYTPGTHIPILNASICDNVDYVFLGAWNFAEEIKEKEHEFISRGGKFITHVPMVRFI